MTKYFRNKGIEYKITLSGPDFFVYVRKEWESDWGSVGSFCLQEKDWVITTPRIHLVNKPALLKFLKNWENES